jgi:hypothetical protein
MEEEGKEAPPIELLPVDEQGFTKSFNIDEFD